VEAPDLFAGVPDSLETTDTVLYTLRDLAPRWCRQNHCRIYREAAGQE